MGTGAIMVGAMPLAPAVQAGAASGPSAINPAAVARPHAAYIQLAAANNPCNPCAAKNPCNPCNPCAAKNPCNPCAAKNPCNPCNPCAAGGGALSANCVVPRLKAAANPCNPCAAKNPCNPCAAKNPCNPCAAKNPCNPCAAKNPCNPCAAKNPCVAANPCNPCAAKNPCNPCAAKNPCNPCAAGDTVELTHPERHAVYNCLQPEMKTGYGKAKVASVRGYTRWTNVATQPYIGATHGGRYVNNWVNRTGLAEYMKYDGIKRMPVGSVVAKDSFMVKPNGRTGAGPLFVMEKMNPGFAPKAGDWKYTMIMPGGSVFGVTNGKNSNGMKFCAECHAGGEDQDYMLLLPAEFRMK